VYDVNYPTLNGAQSPRAPVDLKHRQLYVAHVQCEPTLTTMRRPERHVRRRKARRINSIEIDQIARLTAVTALTSGRPGEARTDGEPGWLAHLDEGLIKFGHAGHRSRRRVLQDAASAVIKMTFAELPRP